VVTAASLRPYAIGFTRQQGDGKVMTAASEAFDAGRERRRHAPVHADRPSVRPGRALGRGR